MSDVAPSITGYYEMRRRGAVRKPDPNDWTQSFVNSSKITTAAVKPKSKRPSGARKKKKKTDPLHIPPSGRIIPHEKDFLDEDSSSSEEDLPLTMRQKKKVKPTSSCASWRVGAHRSPEHVTTMMTTETVTKTVTKTTRSVSSPPQEVDEPLEPLDDYDVDMIDGPLVPKPWNAGGFGMFASVSDDVQHPAFEASLFDSSDSPPVVGERVPDMAQGFVPDYTPARSRSHTPIFEGEVEEQLQQKAPDVLLTAFLPAPAQKLNDDFMDRLCQDAERRRLNGTAPANIGFPRRDGGGKGGKGGKGGGRGQSSNYVPYRPHGEDSARNLSGRGRGLQLASEYGDAPVAHGSYFAGRSTHAPTGPYHTSTKELFQDKTYAEKRDMAHHGQTPPKPSFAWERRSDTTSHQERKARRDAEAARLHGANGRGRERSRKPSHTPVHNPDRVCQPPKNPTPPVIPQTIPQQAQQRDPRLSGYLAPPTILAHPGFGGALGLPAAPPKDSVSANCIRTLLKDQREEHESEVKALQEQLERERKEKEKLQHAAHQQQLNTALFVERIGAERRVSGPGPSNRWGPMMNQVNPMQFQAMQHEHAMRLQQMRQQQQQQAQSEAQQRMLYIQREQKARAVAEAARKQREQDAKDAMPPPAQVIVKSKKPNMGMPTTIEMASPTAAQPPTPKTQESGSRPRMPRWSDGGIKEYRKPSDGQPCSESEPHPSQTTMTADAELVAALDERKAALLRRIDSIVPVLPQPTHVTEAMPNGEEGELLEKPTSLAHSRWATEDEEK